MAGSGSTTGSSVCRVAGGDVAVNTCELGRGAAPAFACSSHSVIELRRLHVLIILTIIALVRIQEMMTWIPTQL
jgi:hypothetical protein